MTSQRLYDVLKFLDSLDQNLGIQPGLESVAGALANLVNQPAQPNYQSAFSERLDLVHCCSRENDRCYNSLAG